MVQGTSENAAYRIIKNGFGTVASLNDGWYGKGMYFTSSVNYAPHYAQFSSSNGCKIFLVSLVIPGNVYPATENAFVPDSKSSTGYSDNPFGLKGKAPKTGYQSHYVLVNQFHPVPNVTDKDGDEPVVFEGWQTLPLFLVYTSEFGKVNSLTDSVNKYKLPKERSFLTAGRSGGEPDKSVASLVMGEGEDCEGGDGGEAGEAGEDEDGVRDLVDYIGLAKLLRKENKEMRNEIEKREGQARQNEDLRAQNAEKDKQIAELTRLISEQARLIEELRQSTKK